MDKKLPVVALPQAPKEGDGPVAGKLLTVANTTMALIGMHANVLANLAEAIPDEDEHCYTKVKLRDAIDTLWDIYGIDIVLLEQHRQCNGNGEVHAR